MQSGLVDVIILSWNDGPLLDAVVASVQVSGPIVGSVTVVDNGSDPPVPPIPGVTVLRNDTNAGVSAGRNQGARAGNGPLLCFLDSDAALLPETLDGLARVLLSNDRIGLTAPVFTGQAPEESAGRAPTIGRKLARVAGRTSTYEPMPRNGSSWDVEFAIGACQLIRRAAYEAAGGLDESYFYGPEDVDFCIRLRRSGWRVVQVDVPCDHPPRRRHRRMLTRAGLRHAGAVARHLWRQRRYR
jgi:N-acetylglucosaminyl-diphospho-decaprenol L-rhamnosyltransferase